MPFVKAQALGGDGGREGEDGHSRPRPHHKVPEEQPPVDDRLVHSPRPRAHDVSVRLVESKSHSRETVLAEVARRLSGEEGSEGHRTGGRESGRGGHGTRGGGRGIRTHRHKVDP